MKQSIARALWRLADRFDPPSTGVTLMNANIHRIGTEPLSTPWMAKITEGLVPPWAFPQLPNAAGAPVIKASWWRRLLRRFGR